VHSFEKITYGTKKYAFFEVGDKNVKNKPEARGPG